MPQYDQEENTVYIEDDKITIEDKGQIKFKRTTSWENATMIPELHEYLGADITIMNTYYQYAKWEDGKKIHDDFIIIVYKDNESDNNKNIEIETDKNSYNNMDNCME